MIVLDATVLIGHLDAGDPHHDQARDLLVDLGDEALSASVVTLAETLVAPARAGRLPAARAALTRLGVAGVPIAPGAETRLAELRASTGLRLPDCCVILAAETVGGMVRSFDDRLNREAHRLGLL